MQARGYHDQASSVPTSILEALPGARNLMAFLAVQPGEEMLVLTEYSVDPVLLQAVGAAAQDAGARVSIMSVEPFSPGGSNRTDPPRSAIAAYRAADVIVSCVWWAEVHTQALFFTEVRRQRGRLAALHQAATVGAFATGGRFPPGAYYAIKSAVLERVKGAQQIQVTTELGTDLVFGDLVFEDLAHDDDAASGALEAPGSWHVFPYGGVNWFPGQTTGVAVVEESTVTGRPLSPLRLHFEGNNVVEMEGGAEVRELEIFSPSGYYMRHAFVGLNPKVRSHAPQFERQHRAGSFYFGLDALTAADRSSPGFAHCDCQFDRPTISVDGATLVDEGRLLLLDDPAVRADMEPFGDPDRLLAVNPYLW